ncbi:glycosyl transferase [Sphingomonas sp. Leaf412]|uniref:glycosyltransferase family 2 protein n=1 Tax=Sphingomonas sp. Leaf412 TaxID=1736370 RepID=UPI0006FD41D8|nr:glycosyltransferase [Sphingomonas sp. Leaf412]KQT35434.1 glycosyl transferase [Sphingomonas sp. Leaf412]
MTGLAVLTIVRNRAAHLDNLVEGLRRSSHRPDELVVVDMNDAPMAPPLAEFPVRMVRLETDGLPLAVARNRAAAATTAAHLLFLDVDCIPLHDCLSSMRSTLVRRDALICADVRYLGPDDARDGWTEAGLLAAGRPHPVRTFPVAGVRRERNPGLFWSLAFAMRRARFDALGGFDERFTGYGAEDTDFGFRADAAGVPLLFVGGAIACHQHHAVYDPPLQHFADIVQNARRFRAIWGRWPMEGWLTAFADMGLVAIGPDDLRIVRAPTPDDVARARVS